MKGLFLTAGSISGFLAVALGAFGAHALKDRLTANDLQIYHTGVTYQFYHALALLIVGVLCSVIPYRNWNVAGYCFLVGTVIFSGSLYALVASQVRVLGAITPIGGVLFLIGWASLAYQSFQIKN